MQQRQPQQRVPGNGKSHHRVALARTSASRATRELHHARHGPVEKNRVIRGDPHTRASLVTLIIAFAPHGLLLTPPWISAAVRVSSDVPTAEAPEPAILTSLPRRPKPIRFLRPAGRIKFLRRRPPAWTRLPHRGTSRPRRAALPRPAPTYDCLAGSSRSPTTLSVWYDPGFSVDVRVSTSILA
jgi:hypothetical protein